MKKGILTMFLMTAILNGVFALSGRDIMKEVDERDDGETRKADIRITLINKRGRERIREMVSVQKDFTEGTKSIMIFKTPEDVKGSGYLSWEYDESGREDDRWLYLPSLRKERRISGKSSSDYFMGTDFTYDDMGKRDVDDDSHKLIGEEILEGNDCWIIESFPKKESGYLKKKVWVRKDIYIAVKIEYFNKTGLMKTLICSEISKINNIWTAGRMEMLNVQKKHRTVMEKSNIRINDAVEDSFFKVSTLRKGRIR